MPNIIRLFREVDYAAVADVGNLAYPDAPTSEEDLRYYDRERAPHCRHRRWVAERGGRVVGAAEYDQMAGRYHPDKYELELFVHPDLHGQGLGSRLYSHLMADLGALDPVAAEMAVREDMGRGLRFLLERGFAERQRTWESVLDVLRLNPAPYAGLTRRLLEAGVAIKTIPELYEDPDRDHKLYELDWELRQDVPATLPATRRSFDQWHEHVFGDPTFLPDAYFVAVDGGRYVGISNLRKQDDEIIRTGLTAVRRDYRRRGIALALKLHGIAYARAHGHRVLRTFNESNNLPMLSINEKLGFVKKPAWLHMVKAFRAEAP